MTADPPGCTAVTLLGPQRTPTVGGVVRAMSLSGPIATITAGWQEREPDAAELDQQLGSAGINLFLYARWLDVLDRDPDFAAAESRLGAVLDEVHDIYLVRLDHALRAVYAVGRRGGDDVLRAGAVAEAIAAVREIDASYLRRVTEIHGGHYAAWPPHERPVIAEHRAAVAQMLQDAAALVVAGGHVGVLLTTLHLFNVAAAVRSAVIAWSAGAMALTDRVVLFHDRAPQGPGHPELYDHGLSLLRGVVVLPHAARRLMLRDTTRMAVLARRLSPARCVPLEAGTRLHFDGARDGDGEDRLPPGARLLDEAGQVTPVDTR